MLRIPWVAKRRNEDILKELKVEANWLLNSIKLKSRKLGYFGHIKRHKSLEKHILEAKLEGKRRRGRPTKRWTDDIRDWLQMSVVQAGNTAQNRRDYRLLVREATSHQPIRQDK